MEPRSDVSRGARVAGFLLMVCGGVGVVLGVVPFVVTGLLTLRVDIGISADNLVAHGPGAMGMGVDWALLSSADGMFLGGLLFAAGIGWRRGRPWAPVVTLIYGIGGILVCGVDLMLFSFFAKTSSMRTSMLIADGVAFGIAAAALIGVAVWRRQSDDEDDGREDLC